MIQWEPQGPKDSREESSPFGDGGPVIPGSFDQPDPFKDGSPAPKQAYWQKYEGTDALGQPHYKDVDDSGIVHDVWYSTIEE